MNKNKYLLTIQQENMINFWTKKQTPDQIRQSFNLELYWEIKKQRHDNKKIKIGNLLS